jgi:hypothetical protein
VRLEHLFEEAVELTGRDALLERGVDFVNHLDEAGEAAAGFRAHLVDGHPRREREQFARAQLDRLDPFGVAEIHLVEDDDDATTALDREPEDLRVLLGDAFGGVAEHDGDVAPFDRADGVEHADGFDERVLFLHLRLATDAGRVDEDVARVAPGHEGVDGVAGGARARVDEDAFGAGELVDRRRLASVGATDQRDADGPTDLALGGLFPFLDRGKRRDHRVLELPEAASV